MFERARRRLTLRYIGLFALVLALFSIVFYLAFATVLGPNFDVAPEGAGTQAEDVAYSAIVERAAVALIVADLVALAIVGIAAWMLATRTLRPIREAHLRQRRFVADASHEMRTPVAAIRSTAEGGLAGPATTNQLRSALTTIVDSSERLTRVTNDLLLLARTDERLLERKAEPFDLSVVAAAAVQADRAARGGGPPQSVLLEPDLVVFGDPDEIGRVVANLLDNAFKYGGPEPSVTIVTRGTERDAIVEVSDMGPGIAAADLSRIFEPFYRIRQDAVGPRGSGLGLAIAADLAERNGARVTVESHPGAGSTFRLTASRFR